MLALYGVFLSLDIFAPDWYFLSNLFKYAFMIWVFLFALSAQAKKESPAMKTALGITLVCDFLLLFTQYQTLGVSLFCFVQMIYIFHFSTKKRQHMLILVLLLPFTFLFPRAYPFIYYYYACCIALHLTIALQNYLSYGQPCLPMLLAISLFALCDISVAVYNVFHIPLFGTLMWLFYAPSQFLIASQCHHPSPTQ